MLRCSRLRVKASGLLGAVLVVSVLYCWLGNAGGVRIDAWTCARIRQGMTVAEAERIIGGPPGDYRTENVILCRSVLHSMPYKEWIGDDGIIYVGYDAAGAVQQVQFQRSSPHGLLPAWVTRLAGRFGR